MNGHLGTLAIRQRTALGNTIVSCASCGDYTFSWEWDLQLFCMDTGEVVCSECGDELAPDLAAALRAAHRPYSYRLGGKDPALAGWPWEESALDTSAPAERSNDTSLDFLFF